MTHAIYRMRESLKEALEKMEYFQFLDVLKSGSQTIAYRLLQHLGIEVWFNNQCTGCCTMFGCTRRHYDCVHEIYRMHASLEEALEKMGLFQFLDDEWFLLEQLRTGCYNIQDLKFDLIINFGCTRRHYECVHVIYRMHASLKEALENMENFQF